MIVVTGARRSGTSMWMQALRAAGFAVWGEAHPEPWGERLRSLNPGGFWETPLREGINFTTNPDPGTGAWIDPRETHGDVIKVFAQGVARTDFAYLDRVVATIRPWRDFAASRARLAALDVAPDGTAPATMYEVPAVVEWWMNYYVLMRDALVRGYPFSIVAYDELVAQPRAVLAEALPWLGGGDVDAAVATVGSSHATAPDATWDRAADEGAVPPSVLDACDALYARVLEGARFDDALFAELDAAHELVLPVFAERAVASAS